MVNVTYCLICALCAKHLTDQYPANHKLSSKTTRRPDATIHAHALQKPRHPAAIHSLVTASIIGPHEPLSKPTTKASCTCYTYTRIGLHQPSFHHSQHSTMPQRGSPDQYTCTNRRAQQSASLSTGQCISDFHLKADEYACTCELAWSSVWALSGGLQRQGIVVGEREWAELMELVYYYGGFWSYFCNVL